MTFQELYKFLIKEDDAIENIELKGDWTSSKLHGYDKASVGILKNKNSLERIKTKWSKLEHPIDLYIAKGPEIHKFYELGRVDFYFVRDKMKLDITPNDDNITLILTNNKGDEKVPLTPWIIAHRFGHAFSRDTVTRNGSDYFWKQIQVTVNKLFDEILHIAYGRKLSINDPYSKTNQKIKRELSHALGTFKSARDKNLRNDSEFIHELIAQYIINGKVTLNTKLPNVLPIKSAWGRVDGYPLNRNLSQDDKEELEWTFKQKEEEINYDIDNLFTSNIGHIFVM